MRDALRITGINIEPMYDQHVQSHLCVKFILIQVVGQKSTSNLGYLNNKAIYDTCTEIGNILVDIFVMNEGDECEFSLI